MISSWLMHGSSHCPPSESQLHQWLELEGVLGTLSKECVKTPCREQIMVTLSDIAGASDAYVRSSLE